ncbi:hypothetical protein Tco_0503192 [Tanacetum coccineum]
MTGEPATEAPVNGGRNYNGPKRLGEIDMSVKMRTTCTWTERPYEASTGSLDWSLAFPAQLRYSPQVDSFYGRMPPNGNGGVQRFPRAGRRLASSAKAEGADCKTHPLIFPKSSHRREGLAPRCRLFATWGCSMFQGLGCSPIKAVRELGSERRETVRSISGVGVRALRGPFPSTSTGKERTSCVLSYRAHRMKRWVAPVRSDNC